MKKGFLIVGVVLFMIQNLNAQKVLAKQTIKDFAAVCWFNYRYGNNNFIATMNTYLPYERSQVAVLMENLDTDVKGRDEVLKLFYRIAGNYESLFQYFYGLKLTASESKELASYVIAKYNVPEKKEPKTSTGEKIKTYSEGEVSYDYVEQILPNKNQKFFQGTKSFGGHIDDVYTVTIKTNKIKIVDPMNVTTVMKDGTMTGKVMLDGIIKDGKILDKTGKESKFRFKGSNLYYHGEGSQWYVFYELAE